MPAVRASLLVLFAALLSARTAYAQQQVQGFDLERFYPSSAGGGWFVMDALDMHGGFGGAIELTTGYAHDPLVVSTGSRHLAVVSEDAFADLGLAATYDRYRLSLNLDSPLVMLGQSGIEGGEHFSAPSFDLGKNPDTLSDVRLGFDVRAYGRPGDPFRLGASAQLFIPSGDRSDYITDGTYRGMFRLLFAGDVNRFVYAAQLGVHIRPLEEASVAGGPRGSELLFGVAGGVPLPLAPGWVTILGPEIYGETAFQSFFGATATGVEGLLTARFEGTGPGPRLRVKVGAGGGLDPNFGAPEWRIVAAVELFNNGTEREQNAR